MNNSYIQYMCLQKHEIINFSFDDQINLGFCLTWSSIILLRSKPVLVWKLGGSSYRAVASMISSLQKQQTNIQEWSTSRNVEFIWRLFQACIKIWLVFSVKQYNLWKYMTVYCNSKYQYTQGHTLFYLSFIPVCVHP